jgi:hypothetical protein
MFCWFGSKWNASKLYPAPIFDTIIEPFAGSAAYSLRYLEKKVIIAEANPELYELWVWLTGDASRGDIMEIPLNLEIGLDIRSLGLTRGQMLLLKMCQRSNNVGDCWTVSKWGCAPGHWTESMRKRVASQVEMIKHWTVERCGIKLMERRKREPVTWLIDPPYQYNYQYQRPLNLSYSELGSMIKNLRGQVIGCEARCTKTGRAPTYLPFSDFMETVTSRRRPHESHHSKELLYYNLDACACEFAQGDLLSLL